jgi:hypothetical protein
MYGPKLGRDFCLQYGVGIILVPGRYDAEGSCRIFWQDGKIRPTWLQNILPLSTKYFLNSETEK